MAKVIAWHENVKVRVKDIEVEDDGLVFDDYNRQKPYVGTIISKGDEVPEYIKIGEDVVFNMHSGMNLYKSLTNGEEEIMLHYTDCIGGIEY